MTTEFPRMTCGQEQLISKWGPVFTRRRSWELSNTYHHSDGDLLTTSLLLESLVQNNVHENL
jgi:hypothetical protein